MYLCGVIKIKAMIERLIIKEAMKKYGTSVNEVAEKMGITRVTLSTHINGNPSTEILLRISEAIGCDITELFSRKESSNAIPCPYCGKPIDVSLLKKEE